ncbi:MAG: hypothetical protein JSR77_12595 [Planctomycetes bacterium]|nr:hypothetical protein [Planctomycetota bacterium]
MKTVALLSCCGLAALAHGDIVFSDGNFAAGTWTTETYPSGGGGTASSSQSVGTGNPGNALRVLDTVNASAGSQISAFHRYGSTAATRYDPLTQGAIGALKFDLDYRMVSGFGQGQGLSVALKQGTFVYVAAFSVTGSTGDWGHKTASGLTAASFSRLDGGAGLPDFSATAVPMRFGFVTSNSSTGSGYSITVDYDNFSVRVTSVPAPATAAALLGLCALPRRRRA